MAIKRLTILTLILIGFNVVFSYKIEATQDAGRNVFKPKQGQDEVFRGSKPDFFKNLFEDYRKRFLLNQLRKRRRAKPAGPLDPTKSRTNENIEDVQALSKDDPSGYTFDKRNILSDNFILFDDFSNEDVGNIMLVGSKSHPPQQGNRRSFLRGKKSLKSSSESEMDTSELQGSESRISYSRVLPANQKIHRILDLEESAHQPIFRIRTQRRRLPLRPLIGDPRGRGKKLGGGLLGKNRDNLGLLQGRNPELDGGLDFDDYDTTPFKPNKRFPPNKPNPGRNSNFRNNRPRPQVNANLNDEEVFYDELFFDNEDASRSQPQDNIDLDGLPIPNQNSDVDFDLFSPKFPLGSNSPPLEVPLNIPRRSSFGQGNQNGNRPPPSSGGSNVARFNTNGPYGTTFGDYEDDFESNPRPVRNTNNFRTPEFGDDFGPFKDDPRDSSRGGQGFYRKPTGFPTFQELSGGFSTKVEQTVEPVESKQTKDKLKIFLDEDFIGRHH